MHENLRLQFQTNQLILFDVTIYKGTHFETSGYLDYKVFLNPQTHINFDTASHFTHTTPLKASLSHRSLDFTEFQITNNFNEACSVLISILKPRGYSTRFLRKIKSETVREIENPLISTELYKPYKIRHNLPPRICNGSSTTCNKTRCKYFIK